MPWNLAINMLVLTNHMLWYIKHDHFWQMSQNQHSHVECLAYVKETIIKPLQAHLPYIA